MKIISRADAKAAGLKKYFTGKPCPKGHISERQVLKCGCIECSRDHLKQDEYKEKRKILRSSKENKDKNKEFSAKYHAENRERILDEMRIRNKAYYIANKEKIKSQTSAYQKANTCDRTRYKKNWSKYRAKSDPAFAMLLTMRKFIARMISRIKCDIRQGERTTKLLGYTPEEFVSHIQPMFKRGMTWENHGEWHVDHIRPLSSFDLTDIEQRRLANSLHNLQPMWASQNLKKSDSWSGQASLI
jgi:hypothetical protein